MDYKKMEEYKNQLIEGLRHAGLEAVSEHDPIDVLEDIYEDEVGETSLRQLQVHYGMTE
jgi:hypothetical protein